MKIAVLLDGAIKHDARMIRMVRSLSMSYHVKLYYLNGSETDKNLFNNNVELVTYTQNSNWLNRNILFSGKFKTLIDIVEETDFIYCVDYPLLAIAYQLKAKYPSSTIIYDTHEIWIETINQFFPRKGWKAVYGYPLIWLNKFIHFRKEKKYLKSVNDIVTVCDSLKSYFVKHWKRKDIVVVRNCPDESMVKVKNKHLFHKKYNLSESAKIVLYQGQMNQGRGIEQLIACAPFLDESTYIVLMGDGPNIMEFKAKASHLKNVFFHQKVNPDELMQYTASADLGTSIIQPINKSKEYSLPNKLFEYMAAGIPFITNNLPEPRWINEKYGTGLIISDFHPKALAKSILEALADTNLASQSEKNGTIALLEEFNWTKQFESLQTVLNERTSIVESSEPILTIGMPVYNDILFIKETLDSILNQSFENFKLIITDDCSTDGSQEVCLEYVKQDKRIQYIRNQKNLGISKNMMLLLSKADTPYFMWAGDDDVMDKDYVKNCLLLLAKNKDGIVAFTRYNSITENDELINSYSHQDYSSINPIIRLKALIRNPNDGFGYGVFRTKAILKVGFPTWWWPNRKTPYNNIFPTLCFYLAKGNYYELKNNQPLYFKRAKSPKNTHHLIPGSGNAILETIAFIIRRFNLVIYSIKEINKASNFRTSIQILPYMFYNWFMKSSWVQIKLAATSFLKNRILYKKRS